MAYQLGLPILLLRERGVLDDGILERGVAGLYMPEFDLEKPVGHYFASAEWSGVIGKWEGYVRSVVDRKGTLPQLYLAICAIGVPNNRLGLSQHLPLQTTALHLVRKDSTSQTFCSTTVA